MPHTWVIVTQQCNIPAAGLCLFLLFCKECPSHPQSPNANFPESCLPTLWKGWLEPSQATISLMSSWNNSLSSQFWKVIMLYFRKIFPSTVNQPSYSKGDRLHHLQILSKKLGYQPTPPHPLARILVCQRWGRLERACDPEDTSSNAHRRQTGKVMSNASQVGAIVTLRVHFSDK